MIAIETGSITPSYCITTGLNARRRTGYNFDIRGNTKEAIMAVNWSKDIDQTIAAAKEQSRPILLDFSAAPA